jgi:hypothetical protein
MRQVLQAGWLVLCAGMTGRDPDRSFQTPTFACSLLCLQLIGTGGSGRGVYALWDQADADPAAFWAAFVAAGNSRLAQAYRVQRVRRHEYHILSDRHSPSPLLDSPSPLLNII